MKTRREFLHSSFGLAAAGFALGGCAGETAESRSPVVTLSDASARIDDVAYVKSVTGMAIPGEAWSWWDGSNGRYARGHRPLPSAVLVFRQQQNLPAGHLAIVTKVLVIAGSAHQPRGLGIDLGDARPHHRQCAGPRCLPRQRLDAGAPVVLPIAAPSTEVYDTYGFVYGGAQPADQPPPKGTRRRNLTGAPPKSGRRPLASMGQCAAAAFAAGHNNPAFSAMGGMSWQSTSCS